jgi:hypothetical protein
MPSKVQILKLTGLQAKNALLELLEYSYSKPAGAAWNQLLDKAAIRQVV